MGRLDSVQNDICGEAGATVLFEHAAGDAAERLQLSETLSEGDHGLGVRLPLNDCLCLVDRVASFFRDQCPPAFGVVFEDTQPRQLTGYRDWNEFCGAVMRGFRRVSSIRSKLPLKRVILA